MPVCLPLQGEGSQYDLQVTNNKYGRQRLLCNIILLHLIAQSRSESSCTMSLLTGLVQLPCLSSSEVKSISKRPVASLSGDSLNLLSTLRT